ncbi:MAG: hypothetical protein PVH62_03755 [Anaerolineae bacterium]
MIKVLTTPLGPMSLLALIYATTIYMSLSRRLGAVTRMQLYYRGFLVAIAFLSLALAAYVAHNAAYLTQDPSSEWLLSPTFWLLFFHIPLFIGVAINVGLVWWYWSWLLKES